MDSKDYYEVLGVSRSAGADEIKKAYRKLAKKYHPDANPGDKNAEKKFQEINQAYDILGDPKKKKMYDQYGAGAFDGTGNAAGGFGDASDFFKNMHFSSSGNGNGRTFHFSSSDAGNIFDDLFGGSFGGFGGNSGSSGFGGTGFGDSFGNGFGSQTDSRGRDINSEITVTFDEAVKGGTKNISIRYADGHTSSLSVHIPAGIDEGKSIRLKGKGEAGSGGNGDLYLKVHIEPKKGFERKGLDVYTKVNVDFCTAVFGGEAMIHTLDGNVICKIKPGTQCGSRIRLKGKGIRDMKNSNLRGDLYAEVMINVPRNLSPSAREKLREFSDMEKSAVG